MKHECKVTVLETKVFPDLQREYLADPESWAVPVLRGRAGATCSAARPAPTIWHFGRDLAPAFPCAEAWDCISRYIYTALQGGSIMHGWTRDDRLMVACCNDGARRVVFKLERIDIPETLEEEAWLASQDFANTPEDAYTGEE